MKIAMTASTLPSDSRSGASYQAHYLANALVKRGHSLTMFSMSPRPEDALYEHLQLPRAERATIWQYAYSLRRLNLDGYDVLHTHGDDCLLGGKRRPRHVRTLHGASIQEARSCDTFRHQIRTVALALGEYVTLAVADVCVANSHSTLRYFPSVEMTVPCGIDLETFKPGEAKAPRPTILFVGGIQGKKRGWLMLEVFRNEVRRAVPDAELWVVSGETVEGDGIRFFGKVDTQALVRLYQEAWVFCMPSSYEGFGVPYVEAMACGTPVVATPNDGSNEVLDTGKNGVICDESSLGERLVQLLCDDSARRRWRAQGLIAAEAYGWGRVVSQYEKIYRGGAPRSDA